jgi:hypothetical protein
MGSGRRDCHDGSKSTYWGKSTLLARGRGGQRWRPVSNSFPVRQDSQGTRARHWKDLTNMPIITHLPKDRRNPASCHLANFAHNVTSQNGEDGIIEKILELIGIHNQWAAEIGAWDGTYLSNSWNLTNRKGWHAVLVEGDEKRCAKLRETYAHLPAVTACHAFVGFNAEADNAIDNILAKTAIPEDFDVLSIDIDGNDYHVWESMTRYRPRIVIIEYNPTVPNDVAFVQDPDDRLNQGCSLLALIRLGREKGYELASVTSCNGIFVRADAFAALGIADNDIDALRCDDGPRIMFGYDGTVFTASLENLPWTSIRLEHEDMQVLPKALRRYQYDPDLT